VQLVQQVAVAHHYALFVHFSLCLVANLLKSSPFSFLCCGIVAFVVECLDKLLYFYVMDNFAAIDFETANNERSSVCSVGVVIVRGGKVVDEQYFLIHPEPEYYNYRCTMVHGLTEEDTEGADIFPKVWAKVAPLIEGLPLVAHNSVFDEGCLKAVFRVYGMDYPDYEFHCTCRAARRIFGRELPNHQLQTVAARCGYDLTQHHNALADAEACAAIAVRIL
jgi:DNA polymerase-3 subunit epsilon